MMGGGNMCDLLPIPPMLIIVAGGAIGIVIKDPPLSFPGDEKIC